MKHFPKHLISIQELDKSDIDELISLAKSFRKILDEPVKSHPTLRGKTVVNLFFVPSTRTRISFELAQKRLGCDIINFSANSSSLNKGESIKDTILNIEAMKVDAIVVRSGLIDLPRYISTFNKSSIINAGDGAHEHPTQALLDIFSMVQEVGDISGKRVLILGDIKHSRVARSNIYALYKLGADVSICGPKTLLPLDIDSLPVKDVFTDVDEALKHVDFVNVLRVQLERQKSGLFPSKEEYNKVWGLSWDRVKSRDVVVMHPGPMNRGIEIDSKVADSDKSIILEQVTNGVAMRMAIIYKLLGGVHE